MADASARPAPDGQCFVYLIGPQDGPQKIGSSTDPWHRLGMFQKERGCRLYLFGQWPVGLSMARSVERYAHWLLRDKLYQGEWFSVSRDEAEATIAKAIAAMGQLSEHHQIPPVDRGKATFYQEKLLTRFPKGTADRIAAVLDNLRDRSAFIREAVETELARREAEKDD